MLVSLFLFKFANDEHDLPHVVGQDFLQFSRKMSDFKRHHPTMFLVRPLAPNERPLHILRRCLLQFGYTDQDKLEELSGKDNSFLCRFTFAESGVPRVTVGCARHVTRSLLCLEQHY